MANPRRNSISLSSSSGNPLSLETPFHTQIQARSLRLLFGSSFSHLKNYLKKPHAFPFLLSVFLFLTWLSLRIQHSSRFSSPDSSRFHQIRDAWSKDDDLKANLVRFKFQFPSRIAKDDRGWLLDPISIALDSGISGEEESQEKVRKKAEVEDKDISFNLALVKQRKLQRSEAKAIVEKRDQPLPLPLMWRSKAMVESLNEICSKISLGYSREMGRIGMIEEMITDFLGLSASFPTNSYLPSFSFSFFFYNRKFWEGI